MTILAISCQLLAGCRDVDGPADAAIQPRFATAANPAEARTPIQLLDKAFPPAAHQVIRTIEDDPDADGIADYRIIITDTFDARGNLISTTRDEDFEADGISDARSTTYFNE